MDRVAQAALKEIVLGAQAARLQLWTKLHPQISLIDSDN
ncbi:hypothetical protein LNTAR_17933 [Lentisphaera araneosa HTCC2155]|uniref:Uncharacterized protein n=1 Tax=Lentisphaera araneosa HTCC2155 TaxID=313628 RepID=A6DFS5_9BACT|nr:hypothetical protein LNTAR_17933 [Lentisphaera araneosa HTCC2155]